MPRPKHPIAQHFRPADKTDRKGDAIQCRYCGKVKAAGNPTRCQQHLDACPQYAEYLANPHHDEVSGVSDGYSKMLTDGEETFGSSPAKVLTDKEIRASFMIGDEAYLQLEENLENRMEALNMFDSNLDATSYKKLLHEAIDQIRNAFPNVFHELNSLEPDEARKLTLMSQMLHRRRRQSELPSVFSSMAGPRGPPSRSSREPAPFHTATIIAERDDPQRQFVVCRPKDLVSEKEAGAAITVDDLQFTSFMTLLANDEDVQFDPRLDRIVHTFVGGRAKNVTNEVVWRVALEEMHRKGAEPLIFTIRPVNVIPG
ncbi:MAG: hypothetical protein M1828_007630 [Chrysothrix sp. TS-e1954]|nr:MAG: hypothetical protein M1828_007630 [Chrysothrix sp. TS-e1954]